MVYSVLLHIDYDDQTLFALLGVTDLFIHLKDIVMIPWKIPMHSYLIPRKLVAVLPPILPAVCCINGLSADSLQLGSRECLPPPSVPVFQSNL